MPRLDGDWDVDLLRKYLFSKTTPGVKSSWYDKMDPGGKLNNRKDVYKMLTGNNSDTNPSGANIGKSMIPWNQQNTDILETFKRLPQYKNKPLKSIKPCGGVVRLTFAKYLLWPKTGWPSLLTIPFALGNASIWIVKCLRLDKPVLAQIDAYSHFVGIVGFRAPVKKVPPDPDQSTVFEFLCIEPWAGGARDGQVTIRYGHRTAFLGIAHQRGAKIEYNGAWISRIGAFVSFSS